jgi:hypothetical protein
VSHCIYSVCHYSTWSTFATGAIDLPHTHRDFSLQGTSLVNGTAPAKLSSSRDHWDSNLRHPRRSFTIKCGSLAKVLNFTIGLPPSKSISIAVFDVSLCPIYRGERRCQHLVNGEAITCFRCHTTRAHTGCVPQSERSSWVCPTCLAKTIAKLPHAQNRKRVDDDDDHDNSSGEAGVGQPKKGRGRPRKPKKGSSAAASSSGDAGKCSSSVLAQAAVVAPPDRRTL